MKQKWGTEMYIDRRNMKGKIWNLESDRYKKKCRKRSCSLSNGLENEKHKLLNCRETERWGEKYVEM